MTTTLLDLYTNAYMTPSDIYEHLPTFVDLVRDLDAKEVIELGVRRGVSTIAWLYALEDTDGHLTSVDITPCAHEFPSDRWTFVLGDDTSIYVLKEMPDPPVDIVFIDTSHAYHHTCAELTLYSPYVRSGGRVVLHDTEVEHPEGIEPDKPYPVKRAIELFCDARGFKWTNDERCNGLGIIEVP